MVAKEKKCYYIVSTMLFCELLHSLIRRLKWEEYSPARNILYIRVFPRVLLVEM